MTTNYIIKLLYQSIFLHLHCSGADNCDNHLTNWTNTQTWQQYTV